MTTLRRIAKAIASRHNLINHFDLAFQEYRSVLSALSEESGVYKDLLEGWDVNGFRDMIAIPNPEKVLAREMTNLFNSPYDAFVEWKKIIIYPEEDSPTFGEFCAIIEAIAMTDSDVTTHIQIALDRLDEDNLEVMENTNIPLQDTLAPEALSWARHQSSFILGNNMGQYFKIEIHEISERGPEHK